MRATLRVAFAAGAVGLSRAPAARAEGVSGSSGAVTFRAGALDAEPGRLVLRDGVVVAYGRYRLTSEELVVKERPGGVSIAGSAHVAPCPCADPPITLGVSAAQIDADGDVRLSLPRVEIAGVPVFALPWLWLRGPGKPGLLAPIVELRGADGALLGTGGRLPLGPGRGVAELTAAAFTTGGAEITARVETERTSTRVLFDERAGERAGVTARGIAATRDAAGTTTLAWDADALRGDRAISMTPDLFDAARPFDTAAAAVTRAGAGAGAPAVWAGLLGRGVRGAGDLVAGPRAGGAIGGAIGDVGSASGSTDVAMLGASGPASRVALAGASAGIEIDPPAGPFEARLEVVGRARVAGLDDATVAREGAAGARASLGLPFVRRFSAAEGEVPLAHVVDPVIEASAAIGDRSVRTGGPAIAAPEDFWSSVVAPPRAAWAVAPGIGTAFGAYDGRAVRLDARAGAAAFGGGAPSAMGTLRLVASAPILAASLAAAGIAGGGDEPRGATLLGRLRVGKVAGPSLGVEIAGQAGGGAADARLLEQGLLTAPRYAILDGDGWTGAAEARIPLPRGLSARARVDADLGAPELLAVTGGLRYASPCRCFAIDVGAGHRVARDGADGLVAVEIAP